MDEYTYDSVVTTVAINVFGDVLSQDWDGILDKETLDFAVQKLLADNHLPASASKFVTVEEHEVTNTMCYDKDDLYGCGNIWSVSGEYTPNGDWAVSQYSR